MKLLAPMSVCWASLAFCGMAQAAEKPTLYHPPRLPDGYVDMEGIWKNSNLTPLERPQEFTQLTTRPWTGKTHLLRSKERMFEYACHEGNYSMRNILEAARAQK
jgi:hypothetical protein